MKYKKRDYALYKGDEILTIGTMDELAAFLDVKLQTIRFYATKKYQERCKSGKQYYVMKIEDEDDTGNIQER